LQFHKKVGASENARSAPPRSGLVQHCVNLRAASIFAAPLVRFNALLDGADKDARSGSCSTRPCTVSDEAAEAVEAAVGWSQPHDPRKAARNRRRPRQGNPNGELHSHCPALYLLVWKLRVPYRRQGTPTERSDCYDFYQAARSALAEDLFSKFWAVR